MKQSIVFVVAGMIVLIGGAVSPGFGAQEETTGSVKIASLSFEPIKWDKEANLAKIEQMAREAAANGARILVTPEGAVEGYLINVVRKSEDRAKADRAFFEIAEAADGPAVARVRNLAKELGADIVLGFLERDGEFLYNTCAWIDAKGKILHVHRKTHMAQPYFDPEFYRPGYEIAAFDTAWGRVGMMICYERQVPEVARALALDEARLFVVPSYGSRGEWNDIMLRTRARENAAYLVFTHPFQSLVIDPAGKVIANAADRQGITYAELEIGKGKRTPLQQRRPEAFLDKLALYADQSNKRLSRPGHIKVAAVQMRSSHDLDENVQKIERRLAECARQGVRVAVFPECAVTGYFKKEIPNHSEAQLLEAEKKIAEACKRHRVFCLVGTPYFRDGALYNMALVINDRGETVYRQAKIQLVGGDEWAKPGDALSLFRIDDYLCSLIICHDSRYPELVRLPVLQGARLVFYLSCESDMKIERKIEPYRAQVVARAVENGVYIVQANTPQNFDPREGSHGQSRIVDPEGVLLCEASIFGEEVLIEELDLSRAKAENARKSLRADFLLEWWQKGLERIGQPAQ